ncbi:MAG: SET domain-containing protein-lysine N-methyltransferase [Niabella sp.]
MASLPSSKNLLVKKSLLPNAGNGLFTKINLNKGAVVTEYKGRRRTWAQVEDDVDNGYIYHIDDDNVIDAAKSVNTFGRYANDAAGLQKVEGLRNNAEYFEDDNRVFIRTTKSVIAGAEILVAYGKPYWKQVRENMEEDRKNKKQSS